MYGIFTYIWVVFGVNVGKYSIHGAYRIYIYICINTHIFFINLALMGTPPNSDTNLRRSVLKSSFFTMRTGILWLLLSYWTWKIIWVCPKICRFTSFASKYDNLVCGNQVEIWFPWDVLDFLSWPLGEINQYVLKSAKGDVSRPTEMEASLQKSGSSKAVLHAHLETAILAILQRRI